MQKAIATHADGPRSISNKEAPIPDLITEVNSSQKILPSFGLN